MLGQAVLVRRLLAASVFFGLNPQLLCPEFRLERGIRVAAISSPHVAMSIALHCRKMKIKENKGHRKNTKELPRRIKVAYARHAGSVLQLKKNEKKRK